jgi:predicted metal-dependent phosphoesterase TrpH
MPESGMSDSGSRPSLARVATFLRARPALACTLVGLVVVSVLAALPFAPEGPFDPRDWSRVQDVRLEFPAAGALVEPVASLGHAISGAPDIRVAAVCALVWVLVVGGAVSLVVALRRGGTPVLTALRTLAGAGACTGIFLLWIGFTLLVPLPSWRLSADGSDVIIADLQSHTFASHDGLVSARENLARHAAGGYDVVAVTEHNDPRGSFEAEALAEMRALGTGVIPGVEWREPGGGYLLALGLDGAKRPPVMTGPTAFAVSFCDEVHRLHSGAALALPWKISAEGIRRLAAAGVDGFEIVNAGHPDTPPEVRAAILDEARKRGLVLVASSDSHGWGCFTRTWTVVNVPGAKGLKPGARARAVVAALRERRAGDITPVVAGYMGPASTARAVFTPVVEFARYAMELSAVRVIAWWIWAGAILGAAEFLRRARMRPGRTLLASALAILGSGLVYEGTRLIGAWAAGVRSAAFLARVGGWGLTLGLVALAVAAALVALELRRRRMEAPPAATSTAPEPEEGDAQ